jgi:hypothetical protein
MLACDATMIIVAGALALTSAWSTPAWTLLAFGLVSGTVSAFYLPASGSMPRRLVGTTLLPRALALRLAGSQVVSLVGPPLAGLLVVAAGLGGTAALDALTFAVVLLVLVKVVDAPERPTPSRQNVLRDAADGIRLTLGDPRLRPALLLTGVVAGLVLPTGSLLVPLLARARDWSAPTVGLALGAQAVGGILVSLLVSRRGAYARAGLAAAASVAPMALGMAFLATIPVGSVASVGGLLIGAGVGLFASHIGPIILGSSPESHLNRVQAVVALVQSVPLLVTVNVLGNLAAATSPATTLFVVAATLAATGLAAGSRLSHL